MVTVFEFFTHVTGLVNGYVGLTIPEKLRNLKIPRNYERGASLEEVTRNFCLFYNMFSYRIQNNVVSIFPAAEREAAQTIYLENNPIDYHPKSGTFYLLFGGFNNFYKPALSDGVTQTEIDGGGNFFIGLEYFLSRHFSVQSSVFKNAYYSDSGDFEEQEYYYLSGVFTGNLYLGRNLRFMLGLGMNVLYNTSNNSTEIYHGRPENNLFQYEISDDVYGAPTSLIPSVHLGIYLRIYKSFNVFIKADAGLYGVQAAGGGLSFRL